MTPAVEFRAVSYRIGARQILDGITLSVAPGETLVLLGRSGSGKTTLLRMVNGLLFPSSGEVLVEGRPTTRWDLTRLRRATGYVLQEAGLLPHYTAAQNVGLVPRLERWPPARTEARVRELLADVGLPFDEYAGRLPRQLSGGQRQRIGLARALALDPPRLLLDEPFGALDPVTRWEAQRLLLGLQRQLARTVLLVTHDVREALLLGTRIAVLHAGRLERVTPPDEFRRAPDGEARAFLDTLVA